MRQLHLLSSLWPFYSCHGSCSIYLYQFPSTFLCISTNVTWKYEVIHSPSVASGTQWVFAQGKSLDLGDLEWTKRPGSWWKEEKLHKLVLYSGSFMFSGNAKYECARKEPTEEDLSARDLLHLPSHAHRLTKNLFPANPCSQHPYA